MAFPLAVPAGFVRHQTDRYVLLHGDCLEVLDALQAMHPAGAVPLIFADPPYNLSNDGITCQAGRMVSVNKGAWDRSAGVENDHQFHLAWLAACRRVLTPDGSLWVSGTRHVIFSAGFAMQELGYRLLNEITWFKPNAAPNLSCRYFTHSHETLLWAARDERSKHTYNYAVMKAQAGGKQMRSVWPDIPAEDEPQDIWVIPTPRRSEKEHGKHPTQKPLTLMRRIVEASSHPGDVVLDPFSGSGSTGVAALELGRFYIGIEQDPAYLELSRRRLDAALAAPQ